LSVELHCSSQQSVLCAEGFFADDNGFDMLDVAQVVVLSSLLKLFNNSLLNL
jgi:hypothetical protein